VRARADRARALSVARPTPKVHARTRTVRAWVASDPIIVGLTLTSGTPASVPADTAPGRLGLALVLLALGLRGMKRRT
jgi:hypothetical protein